jgi:hypothetical protein
LNFTATKPERARPAWMVDMNGLFMSLPAPCASTTAGARPA